MTELDDITHINKLIKCKTCIKYRRYFVIVKALMKLYQQISAVHERIETEYHKHYSNFSTHLLIHFPEEKQNE